jgi:uncharacterized protein (DUF849 family)
VALGHADRAGLGNAVYFRDGDLLPENQDPLIITAAPYGPMWRPDDYPGEVPVTWDEQVQAAVDCYNAGASLLHIHVRDPKTGKISKNLKEYGEQIGRLREAVPDMVLQVGGSISFAPEGDQSAQWQDYDTRHMLAEIDPKPDQVTVVFGTGQYDVTSMLTKDDVAGTHMDDDEVIWKYSQMVAEAGPAFYIEHIKRLRAAGIQTYFALGYIHQLEIVERLIRRGLYMGPMNGFFSMVGGGTVGSNPFDYMELVRRTPQGSVWTYQGIMRYEKAFNTMSIVLGQHVRCGIEDNLWGSKGERATTLQQIETMTAIAEQVGRKVATGADARRIMKVGVMYDTVEETLFNLGLPPNRPEGRTGFLVYDTDGRIPQVVDVEADGDPRLLL